MFKTGDKVKVFIPEGELTISPIMRAFNGKVTRVSGTHVYRKTSGSGRVYFLEDCVSDYLIPYEFVEEWLIPLESEDSNDTDGKD